MTIREFLIKYGFEIDKRPLEGLQSSVLGVGKVIAAVGAAAVGAAATLFGLAKAAAQAGDDAAKAAQRAGVTVEAFQELAHAAELGGASAGDLETGLQRLGRSMVDAQRGSKAQADAFRELGIEIADTQGGFRSTDDVLMDLAERFASMPDGAKKTATAMELLGRGGAALIPTLNEGRDGLAELRAEAHRLGIVIDAETAASMEQMNDDLDRAKKAARGVMIQIGGGLVPVVTRIANRFREWVAANRDLIRLKAKEWVEKLTVFVEKAWDATVALAGAVRDFLASDFAATVGAMVGALAGFAGQLGKTGGAADLLAIALAVIGGPLVIGAIASAVKAVQGLNLAIAANPIGILVAAMAAAVVLWVKNWDEMRDAGRMAWNGVKEAWSAFTGFFGDLWNEAVGVVDDAITRIVDAVKAMINRVLALPGIKQVAELFGVEGFKLPAAATGPATAPARGAAGPGPRVAPQVTNEITIAGSATPETAREVAKAAERGTTRGLGDPRVRAAMGTL